MNQNETPSTSFSVVRQYPI